MSAELTEAEVGRLSRELTPEVQALYVQTLNILRRFAPLQRAVNDQDMFDVDDGDYDVEAAEANGFGVLDDWVNGVAGLHNELGLVGLNEHYMVLLGMELPHFPQRAPR